ncbi:rhodanese-like domain-containing protein [Trichloromonas sp.]|uniref:rhodanese-like domain-containing protein n=1 Tax=Trichloromonas sp. TaxID=3069249 RepID=UPI003D816FB1
MLSLKRSLLAFVWLLLAAGPVQAALSQNISAVQARELLAAEPGIFLLDVRTVEEYQQLRLEGARLVPIDQLLKRIGELPKDRPILVYCAVGSRSSQVANYLARLGYPVVYNLYGGIYAWQLRGYPVIQGQP